MSRFKKAALLAAVVSILFIALEILLDVQTGLAGVFIMGLAGGILIGEEMAKDSKPKEDEPTPVP